MIEKKFRNLLLTKERTLENKETPFFDSYFLISRLCLTVASNDVTKG